MTPPTVTNVTLCVLGFDFRLDWYAEDDDTEGARQGWAVTWVVRGEDQDIIDAGIYDLADAVMVAIETAKRCKTEIEEEKVRLEAEMFTPPDPVPEPPAEAHVCVDEDGSGMCSICAADLWGPDLPEPTPERPDAA